MDLNPVMEKFVELLKTAKPDQWEVLVSGGSSVSINVRQDEVDKFQPASSLGAAVRVAVSGRLGFAYFYGDSLDAAATTVEQAMAAARATDPDEQPGFPGRAEGLAEVETYDPAIVAEELSATMQRAMHLASTVLAADPRVTKVQPAQVSQGESSLRLVNSSGLDLTHSGTRTGASAMAMAAQNGEQEMGWEGMSARFLEDLDVDWVGRGAGKRAADALGGSPVPGGKWKLILEPQVTHTFLGILASSLAGDNVAKGRSLLADKMGKQVISPVLSLADDGLFRRGPATASFDAEGTPSQRTLLMDQGRVAAFVYDRFWGAKAGQASTGNSVRGGLSAPPGVGFTNLVLTPGDMDFAALCGYMDRGLVINEILGGHTADPVSGEFSFGATGFLVEDGKIVRPVKSIALAGQIIDFMSAVTRVGADFRFVGSTGCSSLLVEGVSVSGS